MMNKTNAILSVLALCLTALPGTVFGQKSPHKNLKFDCNSCHIEKTWQHIRFDHSKTRFELEERHERVKCKSCHNIADFSKVTDDCSSCHADVHQAKMGNDCARCHKALGWEQFDTEEIHANTQFPLLGSHALVDCQSCHQNQQQGDFGSLTTDCITCHQQQYLDTENPNHVSNSFSTDCQSCHEMNNWRPAFMANHDVLFPIFSGEHDGAWDDCAACHQNPTTFTDFTCLSCHEHNQPEMDEEHRGITGYAYDTPSCFSCHPTGAKGEFKEHDDLYFPIFTGKHAGEWEECRACHENPGSQKDFTCLTCHEHEQTKMDDKHNGITGYAYESTDCLLCHPTGEKGEFEDHDNLFFPIFAGPHAGTWDDCLACHSNSQNRKDYTCLECHEHRQSEMDNKHNGFAEYSYNSESCYFCHPTGDKGEFREHDNIYFPIFAGDHAGEWADCQTCHTDPANRNDFTCVVCHEHSQSEMDPKHSGISGYSFESGECYLCHPTGEPGEFREHDNLFFPIFAGAHANEWDDCLTCHANPANRKDFSCVVCHEHQQTDMDSKHNGISGYSFESRECFICHPTGDKGEFREHDNLFFPIFAGTHANQWDDCLVCHTNPASRKDFTCVECHEHRQTEMDTKHSGISGYNFESSECYICHPAGKKGEFRDHDNLYFPIFAGAHANEWDDCLACHANPGNRKDFTCIECHEHRQTEMDSKHSGISGYSYQSSECYICHPSGEKGEFRDHDNLYFPIFAGAHANEWDDCLACHTNLSNRKDFTCLECHEHRQTEMDLKHAGISGYGYQSSECYICHPAGEKGEFRDHDNLYFPIFAGAHLNQWDDCLACHTNPASRKDFSCLECHEHQQTEMDLKHNGISGYVYQSSECLLCHPAGEKGEFRDHDNLYFPIFAGAHLNQWDDCLACHTNPASRKDFSCLECHEHRQSEMDLKHSGILGYSYQSNECLLCHPTGEKGEFRDHDNLYFPIFAGPHRGKWDSCLTCHFNQASRKEFSCFDCHEHRQQKMDDKHLGKINGYVYESTACYECHPNGKGDDSKK